MMLSLSSCPPLWLQCLEWRRGLMGRKRRGSKSIITSDRGKVRYFYVIVTERDCWEGAQMSSSPDFQIQGCLLELPKERSFSFSLNSPFNHYMSLRSHSGSHSWTWMTVPMTIHISLCSLLPSLSPPNGHTTQAATLPKGLLSYSPTPDVLSFLHCGCTLASLCLFGLVPQPRMPSPRLSTSWHTSYPSGLPLSIPQNTSTSTLDSQSIAHPSVCPWYSVSITHWTHCLVSIVSPTTAGATFSWRQKPFALHFRSFLYWAE